VFGARLEYEDLQIPHQQRREGQLVVGICTGCDSAPRVRDQQALRTEIVPTEPVLPESELRSRAVERIEAGRLPLVLSNHIYAGYGEGALCALCDQPIAPDKVQYDVTLESHKERLLFHLTCHLAWQRECAVRLRDQTLSESH